MSIKQKPMDDSEILSIISSELSAANYSDTDEGSGQLEQAMSYYLGLPNGTEVDGRSAVTSTDVADSIEWIMPQIMESFTQVNEIVKFDPSKAGDARQAELESQFVYDVLMKENDGFTIIYQMVKDALMQRNGVLKVYYDDTPETITRTYTGLVEQAIAVLLTNQEIVNYKITDSYIDQQFGPVYDVEVTLQTKCGKIVIDNVPLEEFRVNAQHNSINVSKSRFTAHVMTKSVSDLAAEGYDEKVLEKLPAYHGYRRDYRFAMMDEDSTNASAQSADIAQRFVQVHECCMLIDTDRDGIAELRKITCAGSTDMPEVILSNELLDSMPWVATTGIIMPHKFQGLSITDRVKPLQDQKTAILRNVLDNFYLQNNQRNVVIENQVNMDDMLISRPGGIIRAKREGAITPLITPQIGSAGFDLIRYLDEVRAGRTGVQSDGNASPISIGDRVGSQGVDRLMNAKEALVGLIIRCIAETGIKPLMLKIRELACRHMDAVHDYEFRGEWMQIAPTTWTATRRCTVKVGTGTGETSQKLMLLKEVLAVQTQAIANPEQTLVEQSHIFNVLDDICKLGGLNGATRYFVDPGTEAGKQKALQVQQNSQAMQQKQDQIQQLQAQLEAKVAESAVMTADAAQKMAQYKAIADQAKHQLEMAKATDKARIEQLQAQLEQYQTGIEAANKDDELQYKYDKLNTDAAIALTKIEADSQKEENANYVQNSGDINEPY